MLSGLHAGGKARRRWEHPLAEGRTRYGQKGAGCSDGGIVLERAARKSRRSAGREVNNVFFSLRVVGHLPQVFMILESVNIENSKPEANQLLKATRTCELQSRRAIRHSAEPSHLPRCWCGHSSFNTTGLGRRLQMPSSVRGSLCATSCSSLPSYLSRGAAARFALLQERGCPCQRGC